MVIKRFLPESSIFIQSRVRRVGTIKLRKIGTLKLRRVGALADILPQIFADIFHHNPADTFLKLPQRNPLKRTDNIPQTHLLSRHQRTKILIKSNDTMKMIWHNHIFIKNNVRIILSCIQPHLFNNFPQEVKFVFWT